MKTAICLLLLFCLQGSPLAAAPRVAVSIAPIGEIAAFLMQGLGEPRLIIDEQSSSHHFALRPSHLELIQRSELVIWVDRHFESGFSRLPSILPARMARLELLPALGIAGGDGHFWYSPILLKRATRLIAESLAGVDPEHSRHYYDAAQKLDLEIDAWRDRVTELWRDDAPPILTDHRFLGHFGAEFSQFPIASVFDHQDDHGGLKQVIGLEDWLGRHPGGCLLSLEARPASLAASLAEKYRLRVVTIASAATANATRTTIIDRLENLEAAIGHCAGS